MKYTIYDTTTGDIIKISGVAKGDEPMLLAGQGFIAGDSDDRTQMVDVATETLVPRPSMGTSIDKTSAVADGVDEAVITGVPNGVTVKVANGMLTLMYATVTDGKVELVSEYPVTMSVLLRGSQYVDERYEVDFIQ